MPRCVFWPASDAHQSQLSCIDLTNTVIHMHVSHDMSAETHLKRSLCAACGSLSPNTFNITTQSTKHSTVRTGSCNSKKRSTTFWLVCEIALCRPSTALVVQPYRCRRHPPHHAFMALGLCEQGGNVESDCVLFSGTGCRCTPKLKFCWT